MNEGKDIILSPPQEKQLLEFWNRVPDNPPSLKDITKEIFGEEFDGRSAQGGAIKTALSKFKLKAKGAHEIPSKTSGIKLSDEQMAFITNNAATMGSLEISKIVFSNPALTNLNAEVRAVNEVVKTLDTKVVYNQQANEDIPMGNYEPPNTLDKVLKRANKYVNGTIDKEKLNSRQKKGLEMLINYLHTHRFIRQINEFDHEEDRITFEDAFIRSTYDKPDLAQEEIDQYIEYSNQVVQGIKTSRRKNLLEDRLADMTGADAETMRVSMGLVEAIGKAGTEYDQCHKRQQKLLDDLKVTRSVRLSKQIQENASILNLVLMWRDEEQRKRLLKLGELEQLDIAKEVEKLTNMDEIRCKILGLDKDSILLG